MTEEPRRGRAVLVAVAAGLAAGLVARVLFTVLANPWDTLAGTSALWGLVPFFVGSSVRARGWPAAAVGVISLIVMVASWVLSPPTPVTPRELVMWAVTALVAGACCGLAGSLSWSAGPWPHRAAIAFVAGLVMGEGVYGVLVIGGPQWWLEVAIGAGLPLVLARRWRDRWIAVAGASVIAFALFGAYLLYDAIAAG